MPTVGKKLCNAESSRFLKRLKRGTSKEAKCRGDGAFCGKLVVQQQYDEITTREKLDLSIDWMFVFYRSVANGRFSARRLPNCLKPHAVWIAR